MFNPNGWPSESQQDSNSTQNSKSIHSNLDPNNTQFSYVPDGSNRSGSSNSNRLEDGRRGGQSTSHSSSGTSHFQSQHLQSLSPYLSGNGDQLGNEFFGMETGGMSDDLSDFADASQYAVPQHLPSYEIEAAAAQRQRSHLHLEGSPASLFNSSQLHGLRQADEEQNQWLASSSPGSNLLNINHQATLRGTTGSSSGASTGSSTATASRNNGLGFDPNMGQEFGDGGNSLDLLAPNPEMFSSQGSSSSSSSSSSGPFNNWGLQAHLDSRPQSHSPGLSRSRRPSALKIDGTSSPSASDGSSLSQWSAPRQESNYSQSIGRVVTPMRMMDPGSHSSNGDAVVLTPQAKARYSSDFYPRSQNKFNASTSQTSNEPSLQFQSPSFSSHSHNPSPSFQENSRFEGSGGLPIAKSMPQDLFGSKISNQDFSSSSPSQPSLRSSASQASLRSSHTSAGAGSYQGGGTDFHPSQSNAPVSPTTAMSHMLAQSSPGSTLSGAFGMNSAGGSISRPSSSGLRSVASFTSSTGSGRTSNSGSGAGAESLLLTSERSSNGSGSGGLGVGGSSQLATMPSMHRSHSSSSSSFATSDSSRSSEVSYSNPFQRRNPQQIQSRQRSASGGWTNSTQFGQRQGQDPSRQPLSLDIEMNMNQSSSHSTGERFGSNVSSFESSPNSASQFALHPSSGIPEFDMSYHEAHLAAALAANQIGYGSKPRSPPPSSQQQSGSSGEGREGHRTPTILEEEDSGPQHQQQALRALEKARNHHQRQQQPAMSRSQQSAIRPTSAPRPASSGSSGAGISGAFDYLSTFDARSNSNESNETLKGPTADCSPFIGSIVKEYLETPSRLGMGERTILVMTSRVAQKSYGNEKRFLCPPPMITIIGASWWSALPDVSSPLLADPNSASPLEVPTILTPPQIQVSISGEPSTLDGFLDWTSSTGKSIDVGNPSSEMALSADYLGKQLYITDVDEKKNVQALVNVIVPGQTALDRHSLGTFASKPVKVISKPSKKKQPKGNMELCINHGSIISLFHRLRTQAVSTKYLCVSGPPTWFKGSDGQPFINPHAGPHHTEQPSCFVARTTSSEPFIIYRVDPNKRPDSSAPTAPSIKGYPPPPPNAFPITNESIPIKFNQPVVLQCLHTAVVSPVMIIRKVDKTKSAVGGGSYSASDVEAWNYKEAFGDPLTQLNKVAFELVEDLSSILNSGPDSSHSGSGSAESDPSPGKSGPFLACLNESVGMHKPAQPRRWCSSMPSTPATPLTPMTQDTEMSMSKSSSSLGLGGMMGIEGTPPTSPTSIAVAYAAAQTRQSMSQGSRGGAGGSFSPPSAMDPPLPPPSSDGGKVAKRPRRVSSLVGVQRGPPISSPSSGKGRERGQSLSMVGMQNQLGMSQQQRPQDLLHRTSSYAHSLSTQSSNASTSSPGVSWSVEVGDSDVWTIVSADVASHTFYVPPKVVGGFQPPSTHLDPKLAHLISSPAPSRPITPLPVVELVIPPQPPQLRQTNSDEGESSAPAVTLPCVTLIGENFTPDLFVFFGDYQSERVEVHSSTTIACTPPPTSGPDGRPRERVPVLLVRHDGIIFPTKCLFP